MIKVIYECKECGHTEGTIITWDRTTEVECKKCGLWETMNDDTDSEGDRECICLR